MKKYIIRALFTILLVLPLAGLISGAKEEIDYDKAKKLYKEQCSKCHRINGKGIRRVYPPLKNSDYILKHDTQELLRGMIFGRSGKIVVNGVSYNGVMTTEIDESTSDKDIALILTYVYQKMNKINKIVKPDEVKKARKAGKLPDHK